MAFRDVRMILFNMTNNSLTRVYEHLNHGIYTDPFSPPSTIVPDKRAEWRGESGGDIPIIGSVLTGTEGSVDYGVDGPGDIVHFYWDNPAVGKTEFRFSTSNVNGGPSDFVFFALSFAYDGSVEPTPGQDPPLFAVTQGDAQGQSLIFPIPVGQPILPHAIFLIGLRNKREPISVRRWLKAIDVDPPNGSLRAVFPGRRFNVKELIELPVPGPNPPT